MSTKTFIVSVKLKPGGLVQKVRIQAVSAVIAKQIAEQQYFQVLGFAQLDVRAEEEAKRAERARMDAERQREQDRRDRERDENETRRQQELNAKNEQRRARQQQELEADDDDEQAETSPDRVYYEFGNGLERAPAGGLLTSLFGGNEKKQMLLTDINDALKREGLDLNGIYLYPSVGNDGDVYIHGYVNTEEEALRVEKTIRALDDVSSLNGSISFIDRSAEAEAQFDVGFEQTLSLEDAADAGDSEALFELGLHCFYGSEGQKEDEHRAIQLWKRAAEQGHATAQNNLGSSFEDGFGGLAKDEREALRLYKSAAEQSNMWAQYNLARFYEEGKGGLQIDANEAAKLYKKAADQGDEKAQLRLARAYLNGEIGIQVNEEIAVKMYERLANEEDVFALFMMARFHELGVDSNNYRSTPFGDYGWKGISKNFGEAARLYKIAADKGFANAQYCLANLYEEGFNGNSIWGSREGALKDALKYYELAAQQGVAEAQYRLGLFLKEGRAGLQKNPDEAQRLFELAADGGCEDAKNELTGYKPIETSKSEQPAAASPPEPPAEPAPTASRLEALERLVKLRDAGALTQEEFESEKKKILAS